MMAVFCHIFVGKHGFEKVQKLRKKILIRDEHFNSYENNDDRSWQSDSTVLLFQIVV